MNHARPSHFSDTRWTLIARATDGADPERAKKAFAQFCTDYRRPLVCFAQAKGVSEDEADDIVNELFYRLTYELFPVHNPASQHPETEKQQLPVGLRTSHSHSTPLLMLASEHGGKLRLFLMSCLNNVLRTTRRSKERKAGNGAVISVGDVVEVERAIDRGQAAVQNDSPEQIYEREWRLSLLAKARDVLMKTFEKKGLGARFELLYPLLEGVDDAAAVAAKLSAREGSPITAEGVRSAVQRMRIRMRDLIMQEIRETLLEGSDENDEYRTLLG